jgi:hypothetical protein
MSFFKTVLLCATRFVHLAYEILKKDIKVPGRQTITTTTDRLKVKPITTTTASGKAYS